MMQGSETKTSGQDGRNKGGQRRGMAGEVKRGDGGRAVLCRRWAGAETATPEMGSIELEL
jgi:hypothetical protein